MQNFVTCSSLISSKSSLQTNFGSAQKQFLFFSQGLPLSYVFTHILKKYLYGQKYWLLVLNTPRAIIGRPIMALDTLIKTKNCSNFYL